MPPPPPPPPLLPSRENRPCGNVAVLKKPFEGPPTRNNTQQKRRFSTTEWKFLKTRAYRFPHTTKRKGYFRIPSL